ncbi:LamB/YcsF family protein [Clostridium akagii]|uniref:LamB/YcsF family protein n=1 Tax=Clostridium akagii TaxID=91623 RepID=UPI00047D5ECF|nr:5-oxoprolinase subunit PxpA [Clostridium akagii]
MHKVDLNCDLGESFGSYKIGSDEKVIPYISSANIACGFHASDPVVMDNTVKLAKQYNVSVGAHPGLADLVGFGRRKMDISAKEAKVIVQYQIGALNSFCLAHGIKMNHVKLHGALYNMAAKDLNLALAICEGIYEVDPNLILLGLSGSKMIEAAICTRLKVASEVFADRAYNDDGTLVARTKYGAVITDEEMAIKRVIRMVSENKVRTINGIDIAIKADSICVHGDGIKALEFVKTISKALEKENIKITSLEKIV